MRIRHIPLPGVKDSFVQSMLYPFIPQISMKHLKLILKGEDGRWWSLKGYKQANEAQPISIISFNKEG
jgi:hypothetical protein